MLVLSRKVGERILIGDDVVIIVVRVAGDKCRIGIEAPKEVKIIREELLADEQPAAIAESDKENDVSREVPAG